MKSPAVESCINGRFMRFKFPEPKGGGIVIVPVAEAALAPDEGLAFALPWSLSRGESPPGEDVN